MMFTGTGSLRFPAACVVADAIDLCVVRHHDSDAARKMAQPHFALHDAKGTGSLRLREVVALLAAAWGCE